MKAIANAGLMLCAISGAFAQTVSTPPTFDAASIKPSPPVPTGPNRSMYVGMKSDPGRVSFSNVPLKFLIRTAYDFNTSARIDGGPGWLDTQTYDSVASFPVGTPNDRMLVMLQTMLADRCKLAVHREARDQAVYGFVVAPGGSKLKPYDPANRGNGNRGGHGHLELHTVTISQLGNFFYAELGRFVVDATGLTGSYDVVLDWTPSDTPADDPKSNGPSLMTAVQEQLGLRLDSRRAAIEYLVIDHVEKPAEN